MTEHKVSDLTIQEAVERVYELHPEMRAESLKVVTDVVPLINQIKELISEAIDDWLVEGGAAKCEMMIFPATDKAVPIVTAPIIGKAEMQAATERVYESHPEITAELLKLQSHLELIEGRIKDLIMKSSNEQDQEIIEKEFKDAGNERLRQILFTKAGAFFGTSRIEMGAPRLTT